MPRFHIFIWLVCASFLYMSAQMPVCWDDFVEWSYAVDGDGEAVDADVLEELYELHCHPLNLNDMAEGQLEVLPFLSEKQIADLLHYVELNRPLASLGELMAVESLDAATRAFLQLFCYAGAMPEDRTTLAALLKRSEHEMVVRTDVPFYTKAAYTDYPPDVLESSPNKVYRGSRLYHSLRYAFRIRNKAEAGLLAEKDAGERGVDYVSAYALVRDMGVWRTVALGNYRISFGQGLVVNTSPLFGKSMMLGNLGRQDRGISRHSSMSETGYFSGGAATLGKGSWQCTAFVSRRNADGTMLKDSSGMSALKTDGLHRTPLEYSKKGNLHITDWGGNLRFTHKSFDVSATAVFTHYSLPLLPRYDTPASLYRLYNARGADFSAYSVAYAYRGRRLTLRGETALSAAGGMATLNSLQMMLGSYSHLTLIQRSYGARYVAVNSHAFGNNARPQNESGLFVGWNTSMWRRMKMEAYVDVAYFPWMKYQVSGSSYAAEGMCQLSYAPQQNLLFAMRYRVKSRQRDYTQGDAPVLRYHTNHTLRLQCAYAPSRSVAWKTVVMAALSSFPATGREAGFLVSEHLCWRFCSGRGTIDVSLACFDTDSYAARIYSYEPSLLYVYGLSAYSDCGLRTSVLASFSLFRGLSAAAKLGCTRYFNRSSIGSGTEKIDANHREDLQMQLRWTF